MLPLHCIWSLQGVLCKPGHTPFGSKESVWGPPFWLESRNQSTPYWTLKHATAGTTSDCVPRRTCYRIWAHGDKIHRLKTHHVITDIKASNYPIFHNFYSIIALMLLTFFVFFSLHNAMVWTMFCCFCACNYAFNKIVIRILKLCVFKTHLIIWCCKFFQIIKFSIFCLKAHIWPIKSWSQTHFYTKYYYRCYFFFCFFFFGILLFLS